MVPPRDSEHILNALDQLGNDLREHRRETRQDFQLVREDIASVKDRQARRIGATSLVIFVVPILVVASGIIASVALGHN